MFGTCIRLRFQFQYSLYVRRRSFFCSVSTVRLRFQIQYILYVGDVCFVTVYVSHLPTNLSVSTVRLRFQIQYILYVGDVCFVAVYVSHLPTNLVSFYRHTATQYFLLLYDNSNCKSDHLCSVLVYGFDSNSSTVYTYVDDLSFVLSLLYGFDSKSNTFCT